MSKRSRKQFTIRLVVAIGVALGGISAIGSVIAYSAVERARMIAQETATKPFWPPVPKAEFRLSDQQQLRRVLWVNSSAIVTVPTPPPPPASPPVPPGS